MDCWVCNVIKSGDVDEESVLCLVIVDDKCVLVKCIEEEYGYYSGDDRSGVVDDGVDESYINKFDRVIECWVIGRRECYVS